MRIRSTKPEFWRSKTIAALSWDVRLVLKGLESYVDDNGVGKDDVALIAADVFPRDLVANPRDTLARLSEAISLLSERGLIVRYEADGEDLLYIDRWNKQQRIDKPGKGRFPRPDGTFEYSEDVNRDSYASPREDVANPPEVLAPGTGEQGNRGTGDKGAGEGKALSDKSDDTSRADRFDEFWDTYGKKVDRKSSEAKWRLALKKPGVTADLLIAAAAEYVEYERTSNEGGRFIMGPAKWLLNERWRDERVTRRPPQGRVQEHLALVRQLAEQETDDLPQIGEGR